jgi:hypothetical protein
MGDGWPNRHVFVASRYIAMQSQCNPLIFLPEPGQIG